MLICAAAPFAMSIGTARGDTRVLAERIQAGAQAVPGTKYVLKQFPGYWRENSPYKTLKDVMAAMKADPTKVVLGAGGTVGSRTRKVAPCPGVLVTATAPAPANAPLRPTKWPSARNRAEKINTRWGFYYFKFFSYYKV